MRPYLDWTKITFEMKNLHLNTKAVSWCSQRLAFMMNESRTIREFPRAVRYAFLNYFPINELAACVL